MVKTAPVGIRLAPEDRTALERAAKADARSISAMARKIIAEWLRKNGHVRGKE